MTIIKRIQLGSRMIEMFNECFSNEQEKPVNIDVLIDELSITNYTKLLNEDIKKNYVIMINDNK